MEWHQTYNRRGAVVPPHFGVACVNYKKREFYTQCLLLKNMSLYSTISMRNYNIIFVTIAIKTIINILYFL